MQELPETVLQFGGGKFLHAFTDLILHPTIVFSVPLSAFQHPQRVRYRGEYSSFPFVNPCPARVR
jgi:hypothetical protein